MIARIRAFFAKMSRRTKIVLGVALVVVVILAFALRGGGTDPAAAYQTIKIERGTLVATVGATGTVHARQSATLSWQVSGTVEQVQVQVGDRVSRDDVLAGLNQTSLPQSVITAASDLVTAQQELDDLLKSDTVRAQAQIDLRAAQEAYDKAYDYRVSLNQKMDLVKITYQSFGGRRFPVAKYYKGYADVQTIAKADEDLALKKAALEDAQRANDRIQDGNSAEVAAAEARVAAAQAALNTARIIAPFTGTVTQAEPLPGDQVAAGDLAFRVDDLARLLVDVEISEVDINSVGVEQPVMLTFDAILGKEYSGQVVEVAQAGNTTEGVVNFTVTVELTDADEMVKPGMTAAVTITINEIEDAILVPNRAVRVIDGERVVYVLRDGLPVPIEIRLGSSSDSHSVVVGGDLQEGDLVILNPPAVQFGPGGGGPF
jgi:HlyD family secretion protein